VILSALSLKFLSMVSMVNANRQAMERSCDLVGYELRVPSCKSREESREINSPRSLHVLL
jgi:hypothetical protein